VLARTTRSTEDPVDELGVRPSATPSACSIAARVAVAVVATALEPDS
jgi:hypothetical protein